MRYQCDCSKVTTFLRFTDFWNRYHHHHHHHFTSIFPHKSAGWTSPTNFMLDLMLAKDIKNRMPFRFRRSGLFPRPNKGPFLRDSGLLFGSVGELTISQNHHHEGTKEQIGRPS